jgi:hypothetical protein
MKRTVFSAIGSYLVFLALIIAAPGTGNAEVNVSIGIGLPGLVIAAPPAMVVIPGTYVYYPPEVGVDIFFYHGYWYRPYRGGWYLANGYNGPWRTVGPRYVPRALVRVPPAYRRLPPEHERMPYGTVRQNWRTWERDRHWDSRRDERGGRVEGRDRSERGERGGPGQGREGRGRDERRRGED